MVGWLRLLFFFLPVGYLFSGAALLRWRGGCKRRLVWHLRLGFSSFRADIC